LFNLFLIFNMHFSPCKSSLITTAYNMQPPFNPCKKSALQLQKITLINDNILYIKVMQSLIPVIDNLLDAEGRASFISFSKTDLFMSSITFQHYSIITQHFSSWDVSSVIQHCVLHWKSTSISEEYVALILGVKLLHASYWSLTWLIIQPWRWRRYIPQT
jgi:hypothetical protein